MVSQATRVWHDSPIEVDHDTATVRMDWHHYAPDQVETWADEIVRAAWEHGFERVEFVHGAVDVAARGTPGYGGTVSGRGAIKEILRRRLMSGRWRRWARPFRGGGHQVEEGRMLVALLENPGSDPNARWPLVPPPAH